jgi:hypothetical protein
MTITLPYQFDSTRVVKLILRGVLGLLGIVVVPGILYSLFISHSVAAAIQLLLVGAFITWFGAVVFKKLTASVGTITAEAVVLQPARVFGIQLPGRSGRFPMRQFTSVRVERIFGPLGTAQAPHWHERIYLVGSAGTPDILIARTELEAGIPLGRELASTLGLPYQETEVPH